MRPPLPRQAHGTVNYIKTCQKVLKNQCTICLLAVVASMLNTLPSSAQLRDGFFAYCTSNLDSTGECVNEEDDRKISCLIVPGQIISCPTLASKSVECVWISGITANQAQFWCNSDAEKALYDNVVDSDFQKSFQNPIPNSITVPSVEPDLPKSDEFQEGF